MTLSNVCWLLTLCFALCSSVSAFDYLQLECKLPTVRSTFELIANGEYLEAYMIAKNEQKLEFACFRTTLSRVDNVARGYVEYIQDNKLVTYNKTLTYNADGTVVENNDGELSPYHLKIFPNGMIVAVSCSHGGDQYIHVAYPRNRPDLSKEAAFLAKYFVENPDDYKTEFNNCKFESVSQLRKRLSNENKANSEL